MSISIDGRPVTGLPMAEPGELGFSASRLDRIATSMQKYIDQGMVPGTISMVGRHGKIAYFHGQGLMDVEANKPVQLDTIYRAMSMTKPITCSALMMLYEERQFLLTDPVSSWLRFLKSMSVKGPGDRVVP